MLIDTVYLQVALIIEFSVACILGLLGDLLYGFASRKNVVFRHGACRGVSPASSEGSEIPRSSDVVFRNSTRSIRVRIFRNFFAKS